MPHRRNREMRTEPRPVVPPRRLGPGFAAQHGATESAWSDDFELTPAAGITELAEREKFDVAELVECPFCYNARGGHSPSCTARSRR